MLTKIKSFFTIKKALLLIVLLVSAFLIYRYFFAQAKDLGKTITVKKNKLIENLTLSGEVDAREKATVRFATGGQITWVGVKEGDPVKKYQSIASLDVRSLKKSLEKYLNTYRATRNSFENTKDTYENQVITESIKRIQDNAQGSLDSSVADVEIQDLAIKLANIWSPVEGIVTRATITSPGVIISSPTQAEYDVVNPKSVYFLATIDQTEVGKIKIGDKATLVLDAYPESKLNGVVKEISFAPKLDESGTVYSINVDFDADNSSFQYRLGMTGDLTFVLQEKDNVIAIPSRYLKSESGKKYVWRVVNGGKEKNYVTTGLEAGEEIEITSGLVEGIILAEK